MNRRDFLKGIAGILAASTAPAFVRAQSLMPVRPLPSGLVVPEYGTAAGKLMILSGAGETLAEMELEDSDFEIVPGSGPLKFNIRNTRELSLDIERTGVVDSFSINHPLFNGEIKQKLQVAGSHHVMIGQTMHFYPEIKLH